jgi:hypothetical protein
MCLDGLALWLLGSSCAGRERYLWLDLGLVKGLDLELDMLTRAMALEMEEMLMGLAKQLQNQAQDLTLAPTILWP